MISQRLVRLGSLAGGLLVLAGCSGQQPQAVAPEDAVTVSCVAVMPVLPTTAYDDPLAQKSSATLVEGSRVIGGLVQEMLAGPKVRFVQADDAMLGSESLEKSRVIADQYQCNVVLDISVSRYVERVGGDYGVKQPAEVTFAYRLFETDQGRVLCHGRFDERQQSLMENLFSLSKAQSRGLTWLTAEELARDGLQEKFGECSYLTSSMSLGQ